ncbi:protein PSK SIMULATOR 1-like [Lotus japonicus]|uniref:protein PSK SIMULATOR 1-like n=1 Tax=Lotus japonicus TaxID=34305 RepID=UPI0025839294|nr:protein PSK SIMULATOR 1-like [Lotus japonicus]
MVAESWFHRLWRIPQKFGADSPRISISSFEIGSLMLKVVNLWQSLSDKQIFKLRKEITNSFGIRKLVSGDEYFINRLICAELHENLAHVADSVAWHGKKCSDPILKGFEKAFKKFITMGDDQYGWEFHGEVMEKNIKKMEGFISSNGSLFEALVEQNPIRLTDNGESGVLKSIAYQKIYRWKRQEVKRLKNISLWTRTYDYTINLLARSLFTIYRKINHVFGIHEMVHLGGSVLNSDLTYRSQSISALLQSLSHPLQNILPPKTLGAAALALHYANIIIVIEKLSASPHSISLEAREDLYNMLPRCLRASLKAKLKPCTKTMASSSLYDPSLEEWTQELSGILEWLAPLAHHMISWHSEKSFNQQIFVSQRNVLLVQTLYFADQEKTEKVITELLVCLNYVCKYGRELNAKALAECGSFKVDNEYPNLNGYTSSLKDLAKECSSINWDEEL